MRGKILNTALLLGGGFLIFRYFFPRALDPSIQASTCTGHFGKEYYSSIAQNLFNAMNQYGTNEGAIRTALTPPTVYLTSCDLEKIYEEFGYRRYCILGRECSWGDEALGLGEEKTLTQWFSSELAHGSELYQTLQSMFSNTIYKF